MMNINSEKSLGIHNCVHVLTHVFSLFIKYIVNPIATLDIFSVPLRKIHEKEKEKRTDENKFHGSNVFGIKQKICEIVDFT